MKKFSQFVEDILTIIIVIIVFVICCIFIFAADYARSQVN